MQFCLCIILLLILACVIFLTCLSKFFSILIYKLTIEVPVNDVWGKLGLKCYSIALRLL